MRTIGWTSFIVLVLGCPWARAQEPAGPRTAGRILFVRNGDLFSIDGEGRNERHVTTESPERRVESAAWSPDGKKIAYVTFGPKGDFGLDVIAADGKGKRRRLLETAAHFRWSPDGKRIAFVEYKRDGLRVVDVDDASTTTVMEEFPRCLTNFAWSADSRRICFVGRDHRFRRMDADGRNLRAADAPLGYQGVSSLQYNPKDDRIVCSQNGRIVLLDSDGTVLKRYEGIKGGPERSEMPAWSPDGKRILFVTFGDDANRTPWSIWAMKADGSDPIRLSDGIHRLAAHPAWSPDGTSVVFASEDASGIRSIHVSRADGTNRSVLASGASVQAPNLCGWQPGR